MVMLRYTFDRDGEVLDYELVRPSGESVLDGAVEDMMARADPLPAMPDEIRTARMTWTIPIYFKLR